MNNPNSTTAMIALSLIAILCFGLLKNVRIKGEISHRVFAILCWTGIVSYSVQIILVHNISAEMLRQATFLDLNGITWCLVITLAAWFAFYFLYHLTKNWTFFSDTFASLTLVGQVAYPLFLIGIWLGQGG